MLARSHFARRDPDGKTVRERALEAGFDWSAIGENIAEGQQSVKEVVESWMRSAGHREHILDRRYSRTGVGLALRRRSFPQAAAWAHFARTLPLRWRSAEAIFTSIHQRNAWRGDESASGPGSSLEDTAVLRSELPRLLAELGCGSLLDAPCGDLCWLEQAALPVDSYCGIDIVEAVIGANRCRPGPRGRTFLCLDPCRAALREADVVLCRDGLVHLSFRDARAALANFRACGASWLLATTFPRHEEHQDALTGEGRAA